MKCEREDGGADASEAELVVWQTDDLIGEILAHSCGNLYRDMLLCYLTETLAHVCQRWWHFIKQHWLSQIVAWDSGGIKRNMPPPLAILGNLRSLKITVASSALTWRPVVQLLLQPRLCELSLYCCSLAESRQEWTAFVKTISLFSSLTNLTLYSDDWGRLPKEKTGCVPRDIYGMTQLRTLKLCNMAMRRERHFTALTSLQALVLSKCHMYMDNLYTSWTLTQLTRLKILNNTIDPRFGLGGDSGQHPYTPLSSLTALRVLSMRKWVLCDDTLAYLTNLTTLKLHREPRKAAMSMAMALGLASLTQLTRLSMSVSAVRNRETLVDLTQLRRLSLVESQAGDINTFLLELPQAPRLQQLSCNLLPHPNSVFQVGHMTTLQSLAAYTTTVHTNTLIDPRIQGLEKLAGTLHTLMLAGAVHVSLSTLQKLSSLRSLNVATITLETNGIMPSALCQQMPAQCVLWGHSNQCWHHSSILLEEKRPCAPSCPLHGLQLLARSKTHAETLPFQSSDRIGYLERVMRLTGRHSVTEALALLATFK